MHSDMNAVLKLVQHFQTEGQKIKRYEKNPFVEGDSIVEHLARAARLLVYITPDLIREFPDQPTLVQDVFVCLVLHDDDEIIDGFDIPTANKQHNAKDGEEIAKFSAAVSKLSGDRQQFLISAFSSFRQKSTIAAKIAKALDNITGNQLVIEQKFGLISPHSARFCVEYAQKVYGTCATTNALVTAQIQQIWKIRKEMLLHPGDLEDVALFLDVTVDKIKQLLAIDVMNFVLDKEKVYTPLYEL